MNGFETLHPVIVGVDRSEASHWAVRWAVDEVAGHHMPLRLLHAQEWPVAVSAGCCSAPPAAPWCTAAPCRW